MVAGGGGLRRGGGGVWKQLTSTAAGPAAARRVITGLAPHYALNDKLKRISIIWPSV